jgi:hypothetical protein
MATAPALAKNKSRLIKIAAEQLAIHPYAQRDLVPSKLKKIAQDLDLDAIGVLHAVEYEIKGKGSRIWVIDGQHRLRALLEHGFGEWQVEVKIHTDATDDARASALFLKLNDRAPVSSFDKHTNAVRAKSGEAVGMEDISRKHGLKISRQSGDGLIAGIAHVRDVYRLDDGVSLDKTLLIVTQAWGKSASALEGKVIKGVGLVFHRFNGTVDQSTIIKKLAKYPGGPSGLVGDARGLMEYRKGSLARCIAERVIDTYNAGRRGGKLDPL